MRKVFLLVGGLFVLFFVGCGGAKTDVSQSSSVVQKERPIPVEEIPVIEEYVAPKKVIREGNFATIYFAFDLFEVAEDMKASVQKNAEILKENPELKIKLEGHTDAYGSDEYNFALGNKRALAVKDALVIAGVGKDRISVVSFGETKPVCETLDEVCRAKNRRVNFVIESR